MFIFAFCSTKSPTFIVGMEKGISSSQHPQHEYERFY